MKYISNLQKFLWTSAIPLLLLCLSFPKWRQRARIQWSVTSISLKHCEHPFSYCSPPFCLLCSNPSFLFPLLQSWQISLLFLVTPNLKETALETISQNYYMVITNIRQAAFIRERRAEQAWKQQSLDRNEWARNTGYCTGLPPYSFLYMLFFPDSFSFSSESYRNVLPKLYRNG